ncbi:MAG: 4Fe-4S binding protein [Desulfomonilaceae bacterium]
MTSKVYYDLREQLDQYASGFPSTESGVEIKILEKLFTEQEAELYLNLSLMLEASEALAQRIGWEPNEIVALLERMTDKGLIFRMKKGTSVKYGAVPFVPGSYDFQVKDMGGEFAELFEQYMLEALGKEGISQFPPLRTIPVHRSIDHLWSVAPYEDVRQIIQGKEGISVARCVCRVQQSLLDKGCGKPLETCFQFGSHADYYVDKGMSRFVTKEEALDIIDRCEEAGLVSQPFAGQDAGALCNCCGDCCEILRSIKLHPKPAEKVLTNYYAAIDPEACSACETCVPRCQTEAIRVGANDIAEVDLDRCIGCGLCVTTCPTGAASLRQKPESERREPPATDKDYLMQVSRLRGTSLVPLVATRKSET